MYMIHPGMCLNNVRAGREQVEIRAIPCILQHRDQKATGAIESEGVHFATYAYAYTSQMHRIDNQISTNKQYNMPWNLADTIFSRIIVDKREVEGKPCLCSLSQRRPL